MASLSAGHNLFQVLFMRILRHPWWIIGASACLTGFWIYQLPQLTVRTSIYDLQIEGQAETVRYADFKRIFGSDEIIRLVIKGEDLFAPEAFAAMARLSRQAASIPGVRRVVSLADIKKTVDKQDQWGLRKFADIIAPVTLFQNNLISSDGRTGAITLILNTDADQKAVIGHLNRLIAEAEGGLSLYQIGMPLVAEALATSTLHDFKRLPPIAFAVIAVILWGIYYVASYTPSFSGWSQESEYEESVKE